ncbi:MAG: uroporphyrinogen decarboxylase family protein [Phycisphaerae bacterium]
MDSKIPLEFFNDNVRRYRQLIQGQRPDWAPFRLWIDDTFVREYAHISKTTYFGSFEAMFESQQKVNQRFYGLRDYTVDVDTLDIYFDRERFLDDNPGASANCFLGRSLDDFDRYCNRKRFADIPGVKRLSDGIEYFNARLPKDRNVCHYFGVWGAMDYFSVFRGTEQFFIDLYDNSAKVHKIFSYLTERGLEWLEFARKTWGGLNDNSILFDKLDIGEDYCAYLPADLFDEFVKPYTGKIFSRYKGKVLCSLHTDGDIVPSGISKLSELAIDELMGFSPNIEIAEFSKALPDVILAGNVHPIKVMIEGMPGDVKKAIRHCFDVAGKNGKFVLCTGGAISAGARAENIDAFLEAAYEITKY